MQLRTCLTAAATAAALIGLAGCGSSSNAAADTHPASHAETTSAQPSSAGGHKAKKVTAQPAVITIKDYGYSGPSSVAPGATVTVKNDDAENHTVTADTGGAFDVTADAQGTATFTAPSKPGSYPYHCTFHSNMHATLVVK